MKSYLYRDSIVTEKNVAKPGVRKTYRPKMSDAIRKVCGIPAGLPRNKMTDDQRRSYDRVSNVFRGTGYMAKCRGRHWEGYGCYKTGDGIKMVVDFILAAK